MKYVFFGTPRFAEIILGHLIDEGLPPAVLVANPDRPMGRKKIMTPPPTVALITRRSPRTTILQPERFDDGVSARLRAIKADFFVVAAYAKIIPKSILGIPRFGTFGVHPSLLPKYRGSSPIQSAILGGERETGTCVYVMDEKTDHGPVVACRPVTMESTGVKYGVLEENLALLGAELLVAAMRNPEKNIAEAAPQDESDATYTKKFSAPDGFVAPDDLAAAGRGDTRKAEVIVRMVNALGGEPGVWTRQDGKRVKLLDAKIKDGALRIIKIQREGEKPKPAFPAS